MRFRLCTESAAHVQQHRGTKCSFPCSALPVKAAQCGGSCSCCGGSTAAGDVEVVVQLALGASIAIQALTMPRPGCLGGPQRLGRSLKSSCIGSRFAIFLATELAQHAWAGPLSLCNCWFAALQHAAEVFLQEPMISSSSSASSQLFSLSRQTSVAGREN